MKAKIKRTTNKQLAKLMILRVSGLIILRVTGHIILRVTSAIILRVTGIIILRVLSPIILYFASNPTRIAHKINYFRQDCSQNVVSKSSAFYEQS